MVLLGWVVVGVLLLLFELHHLAFYALFGAVGSLAAAVVALFAPSAFGAQAATAAGVAIVGVFAVRPFVSKAFGHNHGGHVARGVHGGLTGQEAIALDEIGDASMVGHVRLAGERWLAVSGDGTAIAAGTTVLVVAVKGTTLVVWPAHGSDDHRIQMGPRGLEEAPDGADGRTP